MSAEEPTNEDYIIQGLEAVNEGIAQLHDQVAALKQEAKPIDIPPHVTVAMLCLKILNASRKSIVRSVTERKATVDPSENEIISESFNRYPRELKEPESILLDTCCQVLASYVVEPLRPEPPDTIDEFGPELSE